MGLFSRPRRPGAPHARFPRRPLILVGVVVVLIAPASAAAADPPLHHEIDRLIEAAHTTGGVTLAGPADDAEFLRRVYLDLTGTIPPASEVRQFLQNTDSGKRAKLVDRLLASPEHARHIARVFDVWLMERRTDKHISRADWRDYLARAIRENRPLDQLAAEILAADGADPALRPAAKFYLDREAEVDTTVRDLGRLFLGVDLQCAQCHKHPEIKDYAQGHYFGLAAFVAEMSIFLDASNQGVLQEKVLRETKYASVFSPQAEKTTGPRLPGGPVLEVPVLPPDQEYLVKPVRGVRAVPRFSRLKLLSRELPKSPAYARNMANRLWALMMGRGLVHPLDQHHSENPASHPELLDLLTRRLVSSGFDMRAFLREVALSRAYRRSSVRPKGAKRPAPESYAVALLKPLSPEQLAWSVIRATGLDASERAALLPRLRLLDPKLAVALEADSGRLEDILARQLAAHEVTFAKLFGAPAGQAEGEFQATLNQALFIANDGLILGWLEPRPTNLIDRVRKLPPRDAVAEELYLSILGRFPTAEEKADAVSHLRSRADDPVAAAQELAWALLASAEFRFNH